MRWGEGGVAGSRQLSVEWHRRDFQLAVAFKSVAWAV